MIKRAHRFTTCAAALTLLLLPGLASGAEQILPAERGIKPVAVGPPGTEVASAKQLVARLGQCKSLSDFSQMFSNETAAYFGFMVGVSMAMVSAMAESFAKMGEEMAKQAGGPPPRKDPKQEAELRQMRKMGSTIEGIFKRYGMDEKSMAGAKANGQLPQAVRANGRRFLGEVAIVMDSMPGKRSNGGIQFDKSKMPPHPDKLRYKVVSPTRVVIHDPEKPKEKLEARVEDGAWRLHIGDAGKQVMAALKNPKQATVSVAAESGKR